MPPSLNESNGKKEDNVKSLGCKRATRSRGAYCEAGSHWIHYFCDKLTESDIARLHNDPGFIYVCKSCATLNEDTNLKVPFTQQSPGSKSPKPLLVMPKIGSSSVSTEYSAAANSSNFQAIPSVPMEVLKV